MQNINISPSKKEPFAPIIVVFGAVLLNVLSGIILKTLANYSKIPFLVIVIGLCFALLVNGLRFLVWGYAHRRFPLSLTYPLTSIFFPVMLVVAYLYQEPVGMTQWIGVIFITSGVYWLQKNVHTG